MNLSWQCCAYEADSPERSMDFINNFVLTFVVITVVVNLQECFCGVITLDGEDFEENVFSDDTPWIVTIQGRVSEEVVHDVNEEIKDRINIGIIEEKELATTLKKIVSDLYLESTFHLLTYRLFDKPLSIRYLFDS